MRTLGSAPDPLLLQKSIYEEPLDWSPYDEVYAPIVPGENTGTFLVYGQSQLTNVIPLPYYTVTKAKNHMLNPYTGRVSTMKEPMPGASYGNSNIISRLGDMLINEGIFDRVVFCNVCITGTNSSLWARGGIFNPRIAAGCRRLLMLGQQPTMILRHQGENDYTENLAGPLITANIRSEVETIRAAGVTSKVLVSHVARLAAVSVGTPQYETVRAAQLAACDPDLNIFLGPDTDTLGSSYRGPLDIHFLNAAAPVVATLFKNAIIAAL